MDLGAQAAARAADRLIFRPPSHGVFAVKLNHFGIALAPGRLDPKREPVFAMQP
jgi:hypothetical protein